MAAALLSLLPAAPTRIEAAPPAASVQSPAPAPADAAAPPQATQPTEATQPDQPVAAPQPAPPPPPRTLQFSAGPFDDLAYGYWALPAITDLARAGFALTPGPHTFDPYGPETRAGWTEQAVLILLPSPPAQPQQPPFPDVPADSAAAPEIAAAAHAGWIPFPTDQGYQPEAPITREAAFALLATALLGQNAVQAAAGQPLPFTDADAVSPWAKGPITALYQAGYISGVGAGRLDPQGILQRADAAALLDTVLRHLLTTGGHRYRVVAVRQMRATAYGSGEGVGGYTATGTPCRLGEAAANPASLPFGTLLFVTGYDGHGYLPADGVLERIEDTGRLGPNDIDLYIPANSSWPYALFGVQAVTAYVLAPTPVA